MENVKSFYDRLDMLIRNGVENSLEDEIEYTIKPLLFNITNKILRLPLRESMISYYKLLMKEFDKYDEKYIDTLNFERLPTDEEEREILAQVDNSYDETKGLAGELKSGDVFFGRINEGFIIRENNNDYQVSELSIFFFGEVSDIFRCFDIGDENLYGSPQKTVRISSEWDRPVISQKQTVVLFKLMKNKRVFNRSIENTKISEAVNILTGYSKNSIRQDMSSEISILINKNDELTKIQNVLQSIIEDIEKEKRSVLS